MNLDTFKKIAETSYNDMIMLMNFYRKRVEISQHLLKDPYNIALIELFKSLNEQILTLSHLKEHGK